MPHKSDRCSSSPAGRGWAYRLNPRLTAGHSRRRTITAIALLAPLLGGAGLPWAAPASAQSVRAAQANSSIIVLPSDNGPFIDDFNPFGPSFNDPADDDPGVYEPLLIFNDLKPNAITPWLASSYAFSDGGRTITFHLRSGVKWSDGTPFTSADAAFTFQMLKDHPTINSNGIDPKSISAPNPTTLVLKFGAPQFVNLVYIAQTYMVPKHIWSHLNPVTFKDPKPVGTGPYMLGSFSPQSYTMVANPNYWQKGLPKVHSLVYPGYDNITSSLAIFSKADWAGYFEPDMQKLYVAPGAGHNHLWFPSVSVVELIPNIKKYPLNLLDVRKAISLAVNRKAVDRDGESGYEPPVTNMAGIIPLQSTYIDKSIPGMTPSYNPAEAKKLLKAAGLKMGPNGFFESPSGKPINLSFAEPSPFADWTADAGIVADNLKKIGLNVTIDGTATATWTSNDASGRFDLTINSPATGPSPYYMFNWNLNSALSAPEGSAASSDFGRFTSPVADQLLAQFETTDNPAAQKKALDGLEKLMVQKLPDIPLVFGASWDEYSTAKVTGWPSAADPYMVPAPYNTPGDELIMLHLKPKS